MRIPSVSDVLAALLGPQPEPKPDQFTIGPCDRRQPEPPDPGKPKSIFGWIGDRIRERALARALEAGYNDQAAINRDYERLVAAEQAADAAFWEQMRADGVPVAQPGTEAEPEIPSAHVPDPAPAVEASADEPDADAAPELEWEAEP